MKQTRLIMGMPITVNIVNVNPCPNIFEEVFDYFCFIDNKFSTYKEDSEVEKINRNETLPAAYSKEMREVLELAEKTKDDTNGYFNIKFKNRIDTSGIVKGWAIWNASQIIERYGIMNYYVEAGGDIQVKGRNEKGERWNIGIRNPWNQTEIVKVVSLKDQGIATSGTYIRNNHIYNPITNAVADEIISVTVIADNIYEADRLATAAFAMGKNGIKFLEEKKGIEGYMIYKEKIAIFTSNFEKYVT